MTSRWCKVWRNVGTKFPEGIQLWVCQLEIVDLFSFLILWSQKEKNKYHLWILWLYTSKERLFSRCRGLKRSFVLEYFWLTHRWQSFVVRFWKIKDVLNSCSWLEAQDLQMTVFVICEFFFGTRQERIQDCFRSCLFEFEMSLSKVFLSTDILERVSWSPSRRAGIMKMFWSAESGHDGWCQKRCTSMVRIVCSKCRLFPLYLFLKTFWWSMF